ncbi:MAG: glycosyltransferase family 4 protein [Bacteroidia bacterium]|nr:glycosyltransferase family 4 protein [Bacteroidia bacterium]
MPKVLRIINRFNLGGPTYNVSYLTKYMAPEYETLLIGGEKDESEASSDFIVKSLDLHPKIISGMRRSINPMNDYRAYKEIRKIIRDFKPDIVHTHASKAGALGRLAAIHEKVPVIIHTFHGHVFHSYFGTFKTSVFKLIERYLAKRSSAIIAISEEQKRELTATHLICDPEKTHVIPLGFDLDRFAQNKEIKRKAFRTKWGIRENEIVVSIVGRLVPVKNHRMFLDAIAQLLNEEGLKFRALIVGDGELRSELEQYASEKKIPFSRESGSAALIFTSWIKEVDEVLAASDIIALTSWNEGTPVSLIEAHAASCPVVTTNVGGVESIVKHGETGFLCTSDDTNAFRLHLKTLITDEKQRMQMADAASSRVMSKFHYNRLVQDMRGLYAQLLGELS